MHSHAARDLHRNSTQRVHEAFTFFSHDARSENSVSVGAAFPVESQSN